MPLHDSGLDCVCTATCTYKQPASPLCDSLWSPMPSLHEAQHPACLMQLKWNPDCSISLELSKPPVRPQVPVLTEAKCLGPPKQMQHLQAVHAIFVKLFFYKASVKNTCEIQKIFVPQMFIELTCMGFYWIYSRSFISKTLESIKGSECSMELASNFTTWAHLKAWRIELLSYFVCV